MKPIVLAAAFSLAACASQGFDHSRWERVLQRHVNELGEVDYAAIKQDSQDLDAYVRALGEASPDNQPSLFPSRAHQLAYWMNAYNAFVTRGVVAGYPTRSVRDLGFLYGFFRGRNYVAGGISLSLMQLEHDIIRKRFGEPRIHFAIVCASLSCPRLSRTAFTAANLEAELERLTSQFVNERRNVTVDPATGTVTLSALFDWYRKDFEQIPGQKAQTVLDYIRRYASGETRKALDAVRPLRVRFHQYDWSINEPGSRARAKSALERELAASDGFGRDEPE